MNAPSVFLIGFMGTGKSAAGERLAVKLDRAFADLDAEIARTAGMSIPEIFQAEGEDGFRVRESLALHQAVRTGGQVVSCGGGVVLREENRDLLHRQPHVFCLRAKPETLLARMAGDTSRPLLQTDDPAARLATLLTAREPLYSEFARQVHTDDLTPDEVADRILDLL